MANRRPFRFLVPYSPALACITGTSAMHNLHHRFHHTHTHIYIYILSVLSNIHAFVATCRFSWPQQYKYFLARDESWGFFNLPSRGWRLNVASQALLRNASLRQKASEQGDDDGTDGIPNFGGSAWATNENSWGHLSRATNLYWIS